MIAFKIGDTVKLKNDDGRLHIIKNIQWYSGIVSDYAKVIFEDNNATGFISLEANWSDVLLMERKELLELENTEYEYGHDVSHKEYYGG